MSNAHRISHLISQLWSEEPIDVRVSYSLQTSRQTQQHSPHPSPNAPSIPQYPSLSFNNPNIPYLNSPAPAGPIHVEHHQFAPEGDNIEYPFGYPEMARLVDRVAAHQPLNFDFSLGRFNPSQSPASYGHGPQFIDNTNAPSQRTATSSRSGTSAYSPSTAPGTAVRQPSQAELTSLLSQLSQP